MPTIENFLLIIQLGEEVSVLLFSISQNAVLVIDLLAKRRDHANVSIDSALHLVLEPSLVVSSPVEILFESHKLILKGFVGSLAFA